ncbi:MAG: DNA mismatch repair protein MutS [Lachnospiraceae bacterium]|nr:DNA mismatch repair protein MutS [Lachnospiraceae bacterium]
MAEYTPMMMQYLETKEQYKDCILFYRLGDFYEMFFEDAVTVSRELELTLTGKSCGQEERAPMCGVPYHAAETYLTRLVNKGYRVAICEQVEDPKAAKGLVKREVVRIVTPGTNTNTQTLEEGKNNYLMCVCYLDDTFGISTVDVTTGDYYATQVTELRQAVDEVIKFMPSELICNSSLVLSGMDLEDFKNRLNVSVCTLEDWYFDEDVCKTELKQHFKTGTIDGLGLKDYEIGTIAAGAVLRYLYETQKNSLSHITRLLPYSTGKYMIIDSSTRRNLELTETLREKQKRGSLLWVLDKTKTAMGARMLRSFIEQPLIKQQDIEERLDAIEELNHNVITREEIREYLDAVYDLERLMGKVSYKSANPRDMIALKTSLKMLPHIRFLIQELVSPEWKQIYEDMDSLDDLAALIEAAIDEEPPLTIKEGGIIKPGYHEEVDRLRLAKTEGKNWLAALEQEEKERTGIKNLRIKFNRVFGYYLEVTNSYKELVPETWIRKQTLTNAERYTTPELKKMEEDILGAEDKLFSLEYDLFTEVREKIAEEVLRIQKTAKAVARTDAFASLALVAERNRYVRPQISTDGEIVIKNGRHPVVERMISNDLFVENDTWLNNNEKRISIITGPNMAGKSTYMRQTALIVLMAQIGSFVPAENAKIGIVDRIFTRVGASDDLASGQSTFMVEMTEVANILRNATKNSLLILDEIGRGTSTYDGLSIAWSVVEHIADAKKLGAKTLFATHYHELTELEGRLPSVNNYCIAVKEQGEDIIFLRKIIKGGADKSYGIQVARLAGVPEEVLKRAREIADQLSDSDINVQAPVVAIKETKASKQKETVGQLSLFDTPDYSAVIEEIKTLDISKVTPIDALNKLYALQEKLK